MKTLSLLRHAKSSWGDATLADQERPLNARGERDAPEMGRRLCTAGIRPSLILSSPAVRAWETAKIIAQALGYPREFLQREADIYMASVPALLELIIQQDDGFNHIMIVGHNPGLTDFANHLLPGLIDNLPTAGALTFEIESHTWDLRENGPVRVVSFDYPKNRPGKKP